MPKTWVFICLSTFGFRNHYITHINSYNNLAKKYNMHSDIFQVPCSIMQIIQFLNMVITQCNHFKVNLLLYPGGLFMQSIFRC